MMIFLAHFPLETVTIVGILWIMFSIILAIALRWMVVGKKNERKKTEYPHEGGHHIDTFSARGNPFATKGSIQKLALKNRAHLDTPHHLI